MLQDPQGVPDVSALAAVTMPLASPIQVASGFNDAADDSDPRQALAAPPAAIAASDTDVLVAQATLPGRDLQSGLYGASSLPATLPGRDLQSGLSLSPSLQAADGEAVVSPSLGGVSFSLPHVQQTHLNMQPQPSAAPLPQTAIPQPVASQAWGGMVGERVVWMFGQQHQSAEIMLNPPALGPLEVRLSMSDGQANLTFTTQHAPVREALEAATPRLREMLSESGIGLGNVSVNVGNFSRQDPQNSPRPSAAQNEPGDSRDFTLLTNDLPGRKGAGLLDLFA
jgi:flagellar hook-length control protein FliK